MANLNIFDVGNFAFYRDPYMEMKLSSDNLFDQLTPDGWIDIWFAGHDKYIPDFGNFKTHVITNKTFYWDIVDENGKRTKEGFEAMWISRNPNMEIWYGDLIPTNPADVFDYYSSETAVTQDSPLITANLWFYNNLFLDDYFRYYVILLPKDKTWPDEASALILPMNDKLVIPKDYYIVGYRPKPEYRFQLAVMSTIKSGQENAIHFRFKLNMDYVFANPTAKRYLKIFSSKEDVPRYLLFPEDPKDLIWDRFNEPFIPYYKRYLLVHGIQQYLPSKKMVEFYVNKRKELLKYSVMLYKLDSFNFASVVEQFKKKKANPDFQMTGIAAYVYDAYMEWYNNRMDDRIKRTPDEIMTHVLFNNMPWAGFERLYKALEGEPITVVDESNPQDFKPTPVPIVEINGVKQFADGWVPKRAMDYLKPPERYIYAGATGNGMYLIQINGKPQPVLCDMDHGGWMLIMDGMLADTEYVKKFVKDGELPEHLIIEDQGVSFGDLNKSEVLFYPEVYFKQLKIAYVDYADNCGEFKVEIYSPSHMFLYGESVVTDDCYSNLFIDSEVIYSKNKLQKANFYETQELEELQTSLTIKMTPGNNFDNVRKYVKFLWAR